MNLYEALGKVPVSTVAIVVGVFLAYRWGRTVAKWAWENKWGVLREAVALTFLAAVLVALKAVNLPDEVPTVTLGTFNVSLPSVEGDWTPGRNCGIAFFSVSLLAAVGSVFFGISDWYHHTCNRSVCLKWQWSVVLVFAGIAAAILSLVFLCRQFLPPA